MKKDVCWILAGYEDTDGWGMCLDMKFYYETFIVWRMKSKAYCGRKKLHMVSELAFLSKVSGSEKSGRRSRGMDGYKQKGNTINLLHSRMNEWTQLCRSEWHDANKVDPRLTAATMTVALVLTMPKNSQATPEFEAKTDNKCATIIFLWEPDPLLMQSSSDQRYTSSPQKNKTAQTA